MKSQLDQLDTDAALLLYAAGELSADDRRRVEAILARDPAARAAAEQLASTDADLQHAFDNLDALTRIPVDPRVAQRNVSRMVYDWAATRPERPPTVVQKVVRLKYPWWTYPLTAAAAVFLAFLVWWGNTPLRTTQYGSTQTPIPEAVEEVEPVDEETQLVEDLERSFVHASQEGIRQVEGDLFALRQSSFAPAEEPAADDPQPQEVNQ